MTKYLVSFKITGTAQIVVVAENEDDAVNAATASLSLDNIVSWEEDRDTAVAEEV